ncbi:MAG: TIGR02594 family protein [Rhizobiales bacterium]|nr:TIGR02594 family protein [Hyphomicrobiales bacterium]
MVKLRALNRAVRFAVFLLSSLAIVAFASSPASARPSHHHGARHHAHGHHHHYHRAHHGKRYRIRHRRHGSHRRSEAAETSDWGRHAQQLRRVGRTQAKATTETPDSVGGFSGGSSLVAEARRFIGGNPTGRASLWCARFMNMVLQKTGHRGTGSDMARSFASYGHRVSGPQVGAIAVMSRGRRGGHVGVVSGVDAKGNPIIVSGNHGRKVAEAVYPRGRVYAYVMPN